MSTAIDDNMQNVQDLLKEGKEHLFVIPEYQRPYAWTDEQIDSLFDDLWDFMISRGGSKRKAFYFLGSIVSYENEDGDREIIDGQQRITTLFLLLRAIYTKLDSTQEKSKEADNFIRLIEPAIWRTDALTGEVDKSSILIDSRVINNEGNKILKNILETGVADSEAKDNYSKNYIKIQERIDQASMEDPLNIFQFFYVLLNQTIVLPITAGSQDAALTIFSTLNDRGLPLSDADIFKAKIYNHLDNDKRAQEQFTVKWQNLSKSAEEHNESIQKLFYYYMFYLRAQENDTKSTTPGVHTYFLNNGCSRLYDPSLLDNLETLLNLWIVVNSRDPIENEPWSNNIEIQEVLDGLSSYPNEFWKYPVVTFFLAHREDNHFEREFLLFLRKLFLELLTKYLETPTINAVKSDILKLNAEIIGSSKPTFNFKPTNFEYVNSHIKNPHSNTVRMLLKLLAYDKQDELLPEKWEIEHIFPQKWEKNYFPSESDNTIQEKIEHLGNKTPFEKKLNIAASNGFFTKKQEEYAESKISITKELSKINTQWGLDEIAERDTHITDEVKDKLVEWNNDYNNYDPYSLDEHTSEPTPEELKQIKNFRDKGFI